MGNQAGESGEKRESESGSAHRENHCEVKPGREGKETQRLSSEMLKLKADERKRKSGTGPGEET